MPIFSTLFAIRADMRHRCCVMEWACGRWCRIHKGYASLHETLIAIITTWVETQTTNQRPYDHGRWPEANAGDSIDKDRIVCYAYMMLTAPITINPEKKGLL